MSGRGGRSSSSSGGGGGRGRGGRGKGGGRGRGRGRNGGRGKSSSAKNNNNNNNNTASSNNGRQPKKLQAPSNLLKNGDKGADVHVVPEPVRIHFTELLLKFRENPDETILELPPTLTNTERKFLHQLAPQLGLKSKSTGKGENRRIAVSKPSLLESSKKKSNDWSALPTLDIGAPGKRTLQQYLHKFPPNHYEELESHHTGSSLVEAMHQDHQQSSTSGNGVSTELLQSLEQFHLQEQTTTATLQDQRTFNHHRNNKPSLDLRREIHTQMQQHKQSHKEFQKIQQTVRSILPAYAHEQEIIATVQSTPVTIIQGETGCGKSTQVPQFLLDANPECNIVVTQREYCSYHRYGM